MASNHSYQLVRYAEPLLLRGGDLPRREHMRRGDSPESSPVNPVGSEPDRSIEHQAIGGLFDRTVGEGRAVENLLRYVRVASDHHPGLAEAVSHEPLGADPRRRRGEPAVSQISHEVEASEDGESPGARNYRVGNIGGDGGGMSGFTFLPSVVPAVSSPRRAAGVCPVEEGDGEPSHAEEED